MTTKHLIKTYILFFLSIAGFVTFAIFCPFANWIFGALWLLTLIAFMVSNGKRAQQDEIIDKLIKTCQDISESSGKLSMTNKFLLDTLAKTEETDNGSSIEEERESQGDTSKEESGKGSAEEIA